MFARLRAALRPRTAPALLSWEVSAPADPAESLDAPAPLPHRAPGLHTARRHTWNGVHHALGALRAVQAWADVRRDPACGSEADVQHTAAVHQLDAAVAELLAARAVLTGGEPR